MKYAAIALLLGAAGGALGQGVSNPEDISGLATTQRVEAIATVVSGLVTSAAGAWQRGDPVTNATDEASRAFTNRAATAVLSSTNGIQAWVDGSPYLTLWDENGKAVFEWGSRTFRNSSGAIMAQYDNGYLQFGGARPVHRGFGGADTNFWMWGEAITNATDEVARGQIAGITAGTQEVAGTLMSNGVRHEIRVVGVVTQAWYSEGTNAIFFNLW
jgi:hypothetical protein